jgi:hypothetical protein
MFTSLSRLDTDLCMESAWCTDMHHLYIRPGERLIQRSGSWDFPLPSERLRLCRVDIHHTSQVTLAALRQLCQRGGMNRAHDPTPNK